MLLIAVGRYSPAALTEVQGRFNPPLLGRVFYGGVTEELLLRWGLMTTLVWLAWRFLQHRTGAPRVKYVWFAIAVSAFFFGVGYLPAASLLLGTLDASIVAFVIGTNAVFGLLFGYLYWQWGLESAMIAHALAHVVNYIANLL